MSDEYQLRKDIDELTQNINQIRSELIDIGLIDANATAQQISDVMGNIFSLRNDLDDFNITLNTFESSLDNFDVQLNGDATHSGFVDYLDTLKTYIYGGDDYDYLHPSSTSLKGVLDNLQTQIGQIISGDQQLSIDLGVLGEYLDGFSGTLEQFKDELEEHGIDLTNVNDGLINLIYRVNYTKNEVDNHQSDLDDFNENLSGLSDMLGSPTDTSSDNTVYGILNDTSSSAVDLTKTLYSGANGTGTKTNPANDTVIKNLNTTSAQTSTISSKIGTVPSGQTLQGQIDTVDGKVGDVSDSYDDGDNTVYGKLNDNIGLTDDLNGQINDTDGIADTVSSHTSSIDDLEDGVGGLESSLDKYHLPSSNFDWIYVFNGTLNVEDILTLESNYDIPLISYAYRLSDKQWYVRTSNTFVTTSTSTDNGVGACATIPSGSVSGTSLSFYTYELSTKKYYIYTSSAWVEKTDLADFFNQTEMFNSINDDFTSQTDFNVLDEQINDTNGIADTVDGLETTVGNNSSGLVKEVNTVKSTVGDNSSGLIKDINDANSNIENLQEGFDKFNLPSANLDWTYLFNGTLDTQAVLILEQDYNIPTLAYAYKVDNKQWYIRNGSSFSTTSIAPSNPIGVCNQLPVASVVSGTSLSFLCYELLSMKYYTYSSSVWNEQTDLSDFFSHTMMYENIDTDFARQVDLEQVDFSHSVFRDNIVRLFPLIIEVSELPFAPNSTKVVADDFGYAYAYVNRSHIYDGQTISTPRYYKVQWNSTTSKNEWIVMQQEADAFQDSELYVWISQYFRNKLNNISASYIISEGAFGVIGSSGQDQESINSVIDVKLDAMDNWSSVNLNNSYATLYVNEAIRMCELKYQRTFTSVTAYTSYDLHTALIPSDYRPSSAVIGAFDKEGTLIIWSSGNISARFNHTASNISVYGSVMWHY